MFHHRLIGSGTKNLVSLKPQASEVEERNANRIDQDHQCGICTISTILRPITFQSIISLQVTRSTVEIIIAIEGLEDGCGCRWEEDEGREEYPRKEIGSGLLTIGWADERQDDEDEENDNANQDGTDRLSHQLVIEVDGWVETARREDGTEIQACHLGCCEKGSVVGWER